MSFELLGSETVFEGRIISVSKDRVAMPDGEAVREVVRHPGAVAVVALDDEDRVVLVRQYRHPVGRELDELPAGLLDVDGEPALQAARRELFEETRLRADRWEVLLDLFTTPGMTDEAVRVFLARDLSEVTDRGFDPEHEEVTMTVSRRPLGRAVDDVLAGRILNGIAVGGLLAADRARAGGFAGLRPGDAPWDAKPALGGDGTA